jgi:hypothetical protein
MCQRLVESYRPTVNCLTSCDSRHFQPQHTRWTATWTLSGSNATLFARGLRRRNIMRLSFFPDHDLNESLGHIPTFFP